MKRLFKQFSFPGGIPSHVAPETPGSIHEGGELGYALSHAYGAAFDNPDLIVACVVGDGEAETGPLATSWHSNKFLNPVRDGACCRSCTSTATRSPIPPCSPASATRSWTSCSAATATRPISSKGTTRRRCTSSWRRTLDRGHRRDQGHSGRRAQQRLHQAPAVADDRLPHPQGLDRPEGGRWPEDGGLLALAPGADGRHGQAGARADPRKLDEELQAGRAVRRDGPPDAGAGRAGAQGRAAHERQSARQRRPAAEGPAAARLPRLRRRGAQPRRQGRRGDARHGQVPPRRDEAEPRQPQLPPLQPGRDQLQPLAGRARGHQPRAGWPRRCPTTTTSPRTAA